MKKNILHIISVLILILTLSGSLLAQSTVRGFVKSGPEGAPVVAAITIGGDLNGYSTGGSYAIGVSSGTHTLAAVYNGNTISKTLTFAPGNNWMNFWFDPPSLPSDFDGNYYHTVNIGNQTWILENLKATHFRDRTNIPYVPVGTYWSTLTSPGYCFYNNEFDTFKETYGALYNWHTVNTGILCPSGWHIPTYADFIALRDYLGGTGEYPEVGGHLKEAGTTHWNDPNTGADNSTGLTALPGGVRGSTDFLFVGQTGAWWSSTPYDAFDSRGIELQYNSNVLYIDEYNNVNGRSVRCVNDSELPELPQISTSGFSNVTSNSAQVTGNITSDGGSPILERGVCWSTENNPTITDYHTSDGSGTGSFTSIITGLINNTTYYVRAYAANSMGTAYGNEISFITYKSDAIADVEGNYYNIVTIGDQTWMVENLKTTIYNDGTEIPLVTDNSNWMNLSTPGYCFYDNNADTYKETYGALYNWYVVDAVSNDGKNVCPIGWHVPSYVEWTDLFNYLGGGNVAGGKLKGTGTIQGGNGLWNDPNLGATNETGFTALPGGYRWGANNDGFGFLGSFGIWWSTTEYEITPTNALSPELGYNFSNVSNNNSPKEMGLSVRCLMNSAPNIVTNTNDDGPGSLRQAILYANSNPGKDFITFNIPGVGVHTIQPLIPLPIIADGVVIDGYSQSGSVRATPTSPANLMVELDGSSGIPIGLNILSGNCEIKGLIINSFNEINIQLLGPNGGSTIEGNYIGTDASGKAKGINIIGIRIDNCPDNTIGGNNPENRNIIAASGGLEGANCLVYIDYSQSNGNIVKGNYLGVGPDGSTKIGASIVGIRINAGAHDNTIGPGNVISGNSLAGIQMEPSSTDNSNKNLIIGNYIGTNRDGTMPVPNGNGIRIFGASDNIIGGDTPEERNIISGNTEFGIEITTSGTFPASGNVIQGNFIGLNAQGQSALGNGSEGIRLNNSDNIIGGTQHGEGNVISGNNIGINIVGINANRNVIIGNFVGTDANGTHAIPNINGVWIFEGKNNIIGGLTAGERNIISGNDMNGIWVNGSEASEASGNKIQGNYVGLSTDGSSPLGNKEFGIKIREASGNIIGGPEQGAKNVISANGTEGMNRFGIHIEYDNSGVGNIVQGNYIGTDATGMNKVGNVSVGVMILHASNNIIRDNVVSGNRAGISIYEIESPDMPFPSINNKIQGNLVGIKMNGIETLGNEYHGISIHRAKNNIIGGTNPGEGNIVGGNLVNGINLADPGTSDNYVIGNFIGIDQTVRIPLPNGHGISIENDATGNYIGSSTDGSSNLIAYNSGSGFLLGGSNNFIEGNEFFGNNGNAIDLTGSNNIIGGSEPGSRNYIYGNGNGINSYPQADFNRIEGNYIGLDKSGKESESEVMDGISIGGSDNVILNNVVVGHESNGVLITRWASETSPNPNPIPQRNLVEGNIVGMNSSLTETMPNGHGVSINTAVNTKIIRNIIAGNQYNGISAGDQFFEAGDAYHHSIGTQITENSIYSNGQLGIDLNMDWVTENDEGDVDTGPNDLQNYPEIDTLNYTSNSVYIKGHLYSAANSQYTIQLFASKVADNTGYGEGKTYIGSETVTTNSSGTASFAKTFSRSSGWGDVITATATDADGNTSEFSMAVGGLQDQIIATASWPFRFLVNEEGIPRITNGSDITAVIESFNTWENIPTAKIDFEDGGTTAIRNASATDGMNLVSFTDEQFPFPKGVLAMAAKTLRVSPDDDVAYIIDADIVVNPKFVLNDVGVGYGSINEGYYDAQSIITHEIGHVLGLIHTGVVDATMFFMLDKGTDVRSLEQDDRSWASYKYPGTTYNSTFGSISGRVTYGEDLSKPPVAGALLIATNTSAGYSVHAYSDADGYYIVPGLPAGNYNIYVQPLDGDVNGYPMKPGNISTYIYCNTIYTDYPGEYLSAGDSEVETEIETPLAISVSAGDIPTSVIDIVTNKDLTPPEFISVRPTNVLDDKVKVMSDFLIRFTEPVDMATFTDQTCYLELNGTKLGGSYTPLADSLYIILFNPGSELEFNSQYTLNLTDGIRDLKGNQLHLTSAPAPVTYAFSTVGRDGTRPTITSTSPVNEADNVFVTAKIKVLFSELMNTESVNDNFALSWDEGDPAVTQTVDGAISWDNEKRNLTFTPYTSLREDEEYTILISAEVTDLSGNQLVADNISKFKTVEDAAPIIIYLGPTPNQQGVTIETPIVADFSEPIDPSTISTSTFSLKVTGSETGVTGIFDFLNGNSRVVFRPETNLEPGTGYSVLLTTGISDVSDHVRIMEDPYSSAFTTAAEPVSPHIIYLDPANGKAGSVVTISGSGFAPETGNNIISFNDIIAYARTATLNTLTTEVPMGALSGPVAVTVNNRISNQMQFTLIPDYENDPTDYVVTNKSLGSGSSGGSDIGGNGEAVFAMVTNPDGNLVTRIGLGAAAGGIQTIPVGLCPLKVDIDQQDNRAYVTNFASHDVSVIDLSSNTVVKTIPVGENPYGVVVTPDGRRVYVSNTGSGDLSLIDVDPSSGGFDHVVANVPIGSNSGGVDVTGDAGVANVRTGSNTGDITVTGDAGMVLVTGDFGLWIVDSDQESDDYNSVIANVSSGTKTNDVTVTADAGFAIVSTVDGSLLIINLHPEYDDYSGAVIANVPTGTKVSDVKASADAVYIYATDTENDQILIYKFSLGGSGSSGGSSTSGITLIPLDPITVGDAPAGIAISPAGDKVYTITGTAERSVTTITFTGGILSPESSIAGLIVTIQTMINEGKIPIVRGKALIVILNAALRNVYNDRPKLAIADLKLFIATVKTYIKNKQINASQGNALITSATAIINQLSGAKSGEEEFYYSDIEMETDQDIVSETKLGIIYPNPTRDGITIDYEIADDMKAGKVSIKVYDVTGRVIGNLVNETMEPGRYSTTWNGRHENGTPVSRGIYYIRFSAGKVNEVQRIMLVR